MKISDFTNQYRVQKTLRFALIPNPETRKHIEESGLINVDENRAEKYILAKDIIDDYHRHFIDINSAVVPYKL